MLATHPSAPGRKKDYAMSTLIPKSSTELAVVLFSLVLATLTRISFAQPQGRPDRMVPGAGIAQGRQSPLSEEPSLPPSIERKQKRDLLKLNFEKMRQNAEELAALAKDLQEELDKSNPDVLSLKAVDEVDKIEKLAKKIKSAARGY
jgi:hypothetical protein